MKKGPPVALPPVDFSAADLAVDLSFDGQGEQTAAPKWTRANESRPRISQQLGVKVATWTTRQKSVRALVIDAQRFERAVDAVQRMPAPGEYLHIVTGQEFAGFDLLPAMLHLCKADAFETLTLTTLGFSRKNLEALATFIDAGKVPPRRLQILCSDFFRRADLDIWRLGVEQAKRYGYGFRSTRNHTKLILANIGGKYFVTESSANLRSCANLEQFTMTQSRAVHDFHLQWITLAWKTSDE